MSISIFFIYMSDVCVLYCIYCAYMHVYLWLHLFCNYFLFVWMLSLMLQHLDVVLGM